MSSHSSMIQMFHIRRGGRQNKKELSFCTPFLKGLNHNLAKISTVAPLISVGKLHVLKVWLQVNLMYSRDLCSLESTCAKDYYLLSQGFVADFMVQLVYQTGISRTQYQWKEEEARAGEWCWGILLTSNHHYAADRKVPPFSECLPNFVLQNKYLDKTLIKMMNMKGLQGTNGFKLAYKWLPQIKAIKPGTVQMVTHIPVWQGFTKSNK